jgi:Spy/CpxP family protein refolding chaperone
MRKFYQMMLALGVVALVAGPAGAQGFRGGPGGGGPGMLLNNKSVQQEIKMTEEQVNKIKEVVKAINDKHNEEFTAARSLEGQERFQKMQEVSRAVSQEVLKAADDVLKPEQIKRLKQISLQAQGANAFNQEEVQSQLKVTDEQKEKIKTINADAREEMRNLFQPGGDRQEAAKKMAAFRKETLEKVTTVLTEEQKKSWKDMIGDPFEIKFEPGAGRNKGKG